MLSCGHTGAGPSRSAPRSSRSALSERRGTAVLRIDPGSFLLLSAYFHKAQRGTGGPDPGPVGTKIHCGAQTQGNTSVSLSACCFDQVSRSLGDSSLQRACGKHRHKRSTGESLMVIPKGRWRIQESGSSERR